MSDNPNLYTTSPQTIVVYSTSWCPDCKRTRMYLDAHKVQYLDVDIGKDNNAIPFLEKISNSRIHIPTVIFPDGSILIEPTDEELNSKIK